MFFERSSGSFASCQFPLELPSAGFVFVLKAKIWNCASTGSCVTTQLAVSIARRHFAASVSSSRRCCRKEDDVHEILMQHARGRVSRMSTRLPRILMPVMYTGARRQSGGTPLDILARRSPIHGATFEPTGAPSSDLMSAFGLSMRCAARASSRRKRTSPDAWDRRSWISFVERAEALTTFRSPFSPACCERTTRLRVPTSISSSILLTYAVSSSLLRVRSMLLWALMIVPEQDDRAEAAADAVEERQAEDLD